MNNGKLFDTDNDWWNNACLNFARDDWDLYANGYRKAGDMLVERIIEDNVSTRASLDAIIYPIVFLYRQYLELRLKDSIIQTQLLLDVDVKLPKHHSVVALWEKLKTLLAQADPQATVAGKSTLGAIEECVNQFSKVDPSSTAFRYPVDKDNNPSLPGMNNINVRLIYQTMENISSNLEGIALHISGMLDSKAEYESEMKKLYGDSML
jgi:hypothetical protein